MRWTFSPLGEVFVVYNHNIREVIPPPGVPRVAPPAPSEAAVRLALLTDRERERGPLRLVVDRVHTASAACPEAKYAVEASSGMKITTASATTVK